MALRLPDLFAMMVDDGAAVGVRGYGGSVVRPSGESCA
jgi:hypothetical protein